VPVTRRDAAIPPPLDVAPERALPGSSDRLCPDSDHHRKADKMKSSDPADCQGRRRGHFDPRTGGLGNSCKVILMSPSLRPLVLQILAAPIDYDTGRMGQIVALIFNEIRTLDA
jgi:hypothetical protein